jgi:hypothetical protein
VWTLVGLAAKAVIALAGGGGDFADEGSVGGVDADGVAVDAADDGSSAVFGADLDEFAADADVAVGGCFDLSPVLRTLRVG